MGQLLFELRTLMDMLGIRRARAPRAGRPAGGSVVDLLAEESRLVFQNCPCPLFRVNTEPKILVANPAFCQFVGLDLQTAIGKTLDTTRLGLVYPTLRMDIISCALNRQPLQQLLHFQKDEGKVISVLLWLVPELDASQNETTFTGIILPMAGQAG
jgi:PAS domain S-box-containing protein